MTFFNNKSFGILLSLLLCVTIFVSCVSKENFDKDGLEEVQIPILIELSLTESKYKTVSVTLTHNGSNRDKYIMFITDDMQTSPLTLCEEYLSVGNVLLDQRKKVKTFRNLQSDTSYRVIAVGVVDSDTLCGEPVCLEFTTVSRTWSAVLNPSWCVNYIGEFPDDNGDTNSVIHVLVDEGVQERYAMLAFKYDYFLSFDDIGDMLDTAVSRKLEGLEDDWWYNSDEFYTSSSITSWALYDKEWVIVVFGLNEDGFPTGKYNVSEVISLNVNDTAPKYSDWLGRWEVETTGELLDFKVNKVNQSLLVSGFRDIDKDIIVDYDRSSDVISFTSQLVGLIYWGSGDDQDYYSCYLRGLFNNNQFFTSLLYNINVADGYKEGNTITLYGQVYESNDNKGIYEGMGFVGYSDLSAKYVLIGNYLEFPLKLRKYEYE